MEWVAWTLCGLAAVTLQVTIVPSLCPRTVRPDLVLLIVVVVSIYRKSWPPILLSWLMGLFIDLHSIERSGLNAMTYFLISLTLALIRPYLTLSRLPMLVLTCVAASLAVQTVGWLYVLWMYPQWRESNGGTTILLAPALVTAALAIPLGWLLRVFKLREAGRVRIRTRR